MLLADEPTSMLDVSIRIGILNLMLKLKEEREIAFLYVTHDLASARYVADDILVMYAGQIVEQGPVEEVLRRPAAPVHAAAALGRPGSRDAALKPTRIEIRKGLPSGGGRSAGRLPLRRPLPARDRRLLARDAAARRGATRPEPPAATSTPRLRG